MVNPFRSLRFRLVTLNLAVFGALLVALGVVVLFVAEQFLRREFDQRLEDGGWSIVEAIELVAEEAPEGSRMTRMRPLISPSHFLEFVFQIRRADGSVVEQSTNLNDITLPLSEAARETARQADRPVVRETLTDDTAQSLLGPGQSLRLLTIYHHPANMPPFYLQVGVSTAPIEHAVRALRRTLLVLVPVGLLLGALASERLVARSLAPIGRVAREARRLTAAHLDRRLPVPPGRDEIVEMVHILNDMLSRLQAAFDAQERFIANAAHELKTPITHLLGQAQVLARQVRPQEEYDRFISSIQDDMRHLAMIVESLLLLARADAGLPLASHVRVSVNEVVTDAVERCAPFADQREVRLEPKLFSPTAEMDEPEVSGDAELLLSLVSNLLRNAIRFSPPGERIELEVSRAEEVVRITVRDHGPGIPAEELSHIFDRFYQAERAGKPPGTGLGLSIAHSVAKLHQGRIEAGNLPAGGGQFVVMLPVAQEDGTRPDGSDSRHLQHP
ncbi:MAG: HAMP domain-containing protein [Phycisphaerae bacterium]|nr:HAMP domain-containing protein [Phycisphaerae bacterium]